MASVSKASKYQAAASMAANGMKSIERNERERSVVTNNENRKITMAKINGEMAIM
jgi:hypothetical protein